MSQHTVELLQSLLGKASKAFDAVDMTAAQGKLISSVINAKVFGISDIDQSIVTSPAIAVNHDFGSYATPNHRLQAGFGAAWL